MMTDKVLPIHQRLAEIWVINQQRELTPEEQTEMIQCLKQNTSYCWQLAYLENCSLMASLIADVDWQHEISLELDNM